MKNTTGYSVVMDWLQSKGFQPFAYQEEAWQHILNGKSGLINAPTGTGKTFSIFLGSIIQFINQHPEQYQSKIKNGLQLIWVTPLRALAKDIGRAMEEVIAELGMQWKVGIRNGDTSISERQKQKREMPEVLIITPESLHLLLAQKDYPSVFKSLKIIAVDEWHELMGSKRGVQVELALSRIVGLRARRISNKEQGISNLEGRENVQYSMLNVQCSFGENEKCKIENGSNIYHLSSTNHHLSIWGISATIGNLDQAMEVLVTPLKLLEQKIDDAVIVRAYLHKNI